MCKEAWLSHLLKQLQMWGMAHSKAMGLEDGGEPDVHDCQRWEYPALTFAVSGGGMKWK